MTAVIYLLLAFASFTSALSEGVIQKRKKPSDDFDGGAFFIRSLKFGHASLAQVKAAKHSNKICYDCVITFETPFPDQLWLFTAASNFNGPKGYYYIKNLAHGGRLMSGDGQLRQRVGVYSSEYGDDQLWKLKKKGKGFILSNKAHPEARLTKSQPANDYVGVVAGTHGDLDQVWSIIPRYEANYVKTVIWSTDNRKGTNDFSETVKVSKGLKLMSSSSLSTKVGLETSIEKSIGKAGIGGKASAKLTTEISTSMESSTEETWTEEREVTFTAPAGKQYRVWQEQLSLDSDVKSDNIRFYGEYTIEESDTGGKLKCDD